LDVADLDKPVPVFSTDTVAEATLFSPSLTLTTKVPDVVDCAYDTDVKTNIVAANKILLNFNIISPLYC